ncbi:MAG: hypothetical protein K2N94_02650 [Lachnospiraceae bacterium]|nr:hypothetical protein [Lachnospiraceae bacterium]
MDWAEEKREFVSGKTQKAKQAPRTDRARDASGLRSADSVRSAGGVNTAQDGLQKKADGRRGQDVRWVEKSTIQKKGDGTEKAREPERTAKIVQCDPDPVERIALEGDMQETTEQVNAAMRTLKARIQANAAMSWRLREKTGRDAWVYAGFFRKNDKLSQILQDWDETWSLQRTCGLLLDLGLALRSLCEPMEIMNKRLERGRDKESHRVNRGSVWARKYVPEYAKLQSGPSATTGQLLRLLNQFRDAIDLTQIQAIMTGVVDYWKNGSLIKWILGDYHTAVEVWAVYMWYLKLRQGEERSEEEEEEEEEEDSDSDSDSG